jgi:hypothetical protein
MISKKKPNVFLAGAPKCGTTSLAHWLSDHPQCYVVPGKEPHFFGDFLKRKMSSSEYLRLFSGATSGHKARIDASTSYFTKEAAIDEILAFNSHARFIVMLRNPVELVYSWHSECLFLGREIETDFRTAWRLQDSRMKGISVPYSCENPEMLCYRAQALLGKSLRYLIARVGADKVHYIFMDDLRRNPKRCYENVLEFLSLENDGRNEFPVKNRAKRHRFPRLNRVLRAAGSVASKVGMPRFGIRTYLSRFATVEARREPLPYDFRRQLYEEFRADVRLLEQLTGRDLSLWDPAVERPARSSAKGSVAGG